MKFVPLREAKKILGLSPNTLRKYANSGQIKTIRIPSGQRRFDVDSYLGLRSNSSKVVCYCRVSSLKQRDDLARQVVFMRENFPTAEIIQDIGSGLNFKRKGLKSILDRLSQGDQFTLVVAHKDRLTRFGSEIFEYLLSKNGGELLVLDRTQDSPTKELTEDLLTILHVFSCRMHGLRRYSAQIKKDSNLSN